MPPKKRSVKLPFPVKGLSEAYAYEDQPQGTTVDAQNVRSFPANSTEPSSGNSKASGRSRGGQRPGLSKYVSTAHSSDTSIQNISHMAYSEFTPLSGRGHMVIREDEGGSFTIVDNAGEVIETVGDASEVYNLGQWGRDGFLYTASVDTSNNLIVRKTNALGISQWDWTDSNSPVVELSSATRQVAGMSVFGDYVYLWLRSISGVTGEAIYRVKTSDGDLRDASSGSGTQTDYWLVSEDQTTNDFKDFYPSTGETSKIINPMITGNGMLAMVCFNDSGASAVSSTKSDAITFEDDLDEVKTAIVDAVAMSHLTDDNITTAGGPLGTAPVTITFADNLATQDVVEFVVTDSGTLSGGALTVSSTTQGDKDNSEVVTITSTHTSGSFKLAHDGRMSVQAINIENGKQMFCREIQDAGLGSTTVSASQAELDIAMDELGNIYTLSKSKKGGGSYYFAIAKTDPNGDVVSAFNDSDREHTGTTNSLCYDFVGQRLGAVGGNVYGSGHSFATINATTGAKINSQDAHTETAWNSISPDEKGGFRIFRNQHTNCCARMTEAATPVADWILATQGDNNQTGASCAAFYQFNPQNSLSVRQTKQLAIAGGVVREFDSDQWYDLASGGGATGDPVFDPGVDVIFSTQMGTRLYFADGLNENYYDATDGEIKSWTASDGTLPQDSKGRKPRLIENWRDRIVMAGVIGDPNEYYMSKRGDGTDWEYAPTTVTNTQATSGTNAPAGRSPDVIRTIIPLNDDVLIWGCDQSIWAMSGDPMEEGRIDNIVDGVGMPFGRPWCKDITGSFYFFGSKGGVYRGSVGQGIQKITIGSIEERMSDIDLDKNLIRLLWNEREQGIHIFITPLNSYTAATHYFYDTKANAWWLDKFEAVSSNKYIHNPKEIHIFDGLDPDDRVILLGGWDGFVRKWDPAASDDDGTAIDSYAYVGPLVSDAMGLIRLNEMRVQLGKNSDDVTASVFTGTNAEDAYSKTSPHFTSTFVAGRNVSERRRAMAHAMYVKLGNNTVAERWTLERMEADLDITARKFARIY